MCVEVIQRQWSVILTATLVVYCHEVVILGNIMKKKSYLPFITVLGRLGVVLDVSE